jgi:hypothetical protein
MEDLNSTWDVRMRQLPQRKWRYIMDIGLRIQTHSLVERSAFTKSVLSLTVELLL